MTLGAAGFRTRTLGLVAAIRVEGGGGGGGDNVGFGGNEVGGGPSGGNDKLLSSSGSPPPPPPPLSGPAAGPGHGGEGKKASAAAATRDRRWERKGVSRSLQRVEYQPLSDRSDLQMTCFVTILHSSVSSIFDRRFSRRSFVIFFFFSTCGGKTRGERVWINILFYFLLFVFQVDSKAEGCGFLYCDRSTLTEKSTVVVYPFYSGRKCKDRGTQYEVRTALTLSSRDDILYS